jgi:hypothetical protein
MTNPIRCVALFSGGLDACLAVRMMQQQGIEVHALNLTSPLIDPAPAQKAANALGVPLTIAPLVPDYAQRLAAPRLGRLGLAGCCLDCRVAMLRAAKGYMEATGSAFVVTGEVLGQRPRTSRFDLEMVAIHAGLERQVVRPLSAQRLEPTLPEERGWLDRQKLGTIVGKSRRVQQQLARQLEVTSIPPRPDCPLLAGSLAERVAWTLRSGLPVEDWLLAALRSGRRQELSAGSFLLMARNQQENTLLQSAFAEYRKRVAIGGKCFSGRIWFMEPVGVPGPVGLVVLGSGSPLVAALKEAAAVLRGRMRSAGQAGTWRLSGGTGQREWSWSDGDDGEVDALYEAVACVTTVREEKTPSAGGYRL